MHHLVEMYLGDAKVYCICAMIICFFGSIMAGALVIDQVPQMNRQAVISILFAIQAVGTFVVYLVIRTLGKLEEKLEK